MTFANTLLLVRNNRMISQYSILTIDTIGLMEIHIFVAPLNAPQEVQDKFKKDCNDNGLKCCNLRLDTVHLGMVGKL